MNCAFIAGSGLPVRGSGAAPMPTPSWLSWASGHAAGQNVHIFMLLHSIWEMKIMWIMLTTLYSIFRQLLGVCDESQPAELWSSPSQWMRWAELTSCHRQDPAMGSPCTSGLWALEAVPASASLVGSTPSLLASKCELSTPHMHKRTKLPVVTGFSYLGKNNVVTWYFSPRHCFMLYLFGHWSESISPQSSILWADCGFLQWIWWPTLSTDPQKVAIIIGLRISYHYYLLSFWRSQKVLASQAAGCFQGKISVAPGR